MTGIWNLEQFKEKTAILDEYGQSIAYDTLSFKAGILAESVGRRCLVFSLCRNEIGSVLGYVSFMNYGIVPVLLSAQIDGELLGNLLKTYQPSFLWVPEDQVGRFAGMEAVYKSFRYVLLKTGYEKEYILNDELGLLLSTSGSTGSPKFVRQSYTNILDNAGSIVKYLELDETERPISTLPMNYTYGLSIINSHILVGATLLLTEKGLMQKEFWNFFKEAEATSFGGVPYTYEMLDKLRFFNMNLPSLRTMTQAGGKILPELHGEFANYAEKTGKHFVVMYGQCEATARMGYLPYQRAIEKNGSMGIAIPGGKFRLVDIDGKEIAVPHTTGELIYEGKNVTLGYAECGEDLSKGDERHGILETGDMAQFDEEGYYYIVGRKKRFLKIYGNRVNLDEMEQLIKGIYDIEVACAGIDDRMCIFITDNPPEGDIVRFVSEKTKLNPAAFQVIKIDSIPMNDSGKVRYGDLARYYDRT